MNGTGEQTAAALRILIMRLTADLESVRAGRLSADRTLDLAGLLESTAGALRERVAVERSPVASSPWGLRERTSGPPW